MECCEKGMPEGWTIRGAETVEFPLLTYPTEKFLRLTYHYRKTSASFSDRRAMGR
jgi:hypothetical protein